MNVRKGAVSAATSAAVMAAILLSGRVSASERGQVPVPAETVAAMQAKGMAPGAPVLLRVYKKESVLEVWKQARDGRYAFLKSFPICRWSGQLGPKTRTGDRQAPEGFYAVPVSKLNPNSHYHLSFDTGYPNAYDRAHGASGSALMVHGTCSSAGCYAMTDKGVGEIYALVRDALAGGQAAFQFQAFPFRMTAENLAKHRSEPNLAFWRQLKEGSDRFEATGEEPKVSVVAGAYNFVSRTASADRQAAERIAQEKNKVERLIADGAASIRTTYSDGGQNAIFAALLKKGADLGDVSRPEALAYAGREVILTPARKPAPLPPAVVARATIDDIPLAKIAGPIAGAQPMLRTAFAATTMPGATAVTVVAVSGRSLPQGVTFTR